MTVLKDISYGPHGIRNKMDLYIPDHSQKPAPAVLFLHGGGWTGGDKEIMTWYAESVARRRIAGITANYRLWPDWRYPAALDDAQRIVRWIRANAKQYNIDGSRLGAMGLSAGAHLAVWLGLGETRDNTDPALSAFSSRVQCVVDVYGPVDFLAMMPSASAEIISGFIGRHFAEAKDMYVDASPIRLVRPGAPPFLIVHGTNDIGVNYGEVPVGISVDLHARLVAAGCDARLVKLEGAGHGFSAQNDPYAQKMWMEALPFFEKHLRP